MFKKNDVNKHMIQSVVERVLSVGLSGSESCLLSSAPRTDYNGKKIMPKPSLALLAHTWTWRGIWITSFCIVLFLLHRPCVKLTRKEELRGFRGLMNRLYPLWKVVESKFWLPANHTSVSPATEPELAQWKMFRLQQRWHDLSGLLSDYATPQYARERHAGLKDDPVLIHETCNELSMGVWKIATWRHFR